MGKRTAQKDTIIDITSDRQVNSNFPYRWSPASLTFNNYFYLFLHLSTFHSTYICLSAIDMTQNIHVALETVISLGFERVLTSGGDTTALEGLPTICEMVRQVL